MSLGTLTPPYPTSVFRDEGEKLRILVTGATSFIGQHLCRKLLADGHRVCALTRHPAQTKHMFASGCYLAVGSIENRDFLKEVVPETDAIFHLGSLHRSNDERAFWKTNNEGTKHLVEAAIASCFSGRFIMLTSLETKSPQCAAARSQADSLAYLELFEPEVDWTIFRTSHVVGKGERRLLTYILRSLRQNRFRVLKDAPPVQPLAVEDLVRALLLALDSKLSAQEYDLSGNETVSWEELIRTVQQIAQSNTRVSSTSSSVAMAVSRFADKSDDVFLYKPWDICSDEVRSVARGRWLSDDDSFAEETGWQCQEDWRDALAAWLKPLAELD